MNGGIWFDFYVVCSEICRNEIHFDALTDTCNKNSKMQENLFKTNGISHYKTPDGPALKREIGHPTISN